jgi:DNA topoisomerase I
VLVRFSRKTREHYLASEVDGEPSGWAAYLVDGAWVVRAPEEPAASSRRRPAKV